MEEKRGPGRPRKNPAQDVEAMPEMSDEEIARFANGMTRVFADVMYVSDLLNRKNRLVAEAAQLEGRIETLKPEVESLALRKLDLDSRLATLEKEVEEKFATERANRIAVMQADIDKEVGGYRDAADAQKENLKNDLEKAREEAEAEKAAIKQAVARERQIHEMVKAETKILNDALQQLRQNIASGSNAD